MVIKDAQTKDPVYIIETIRDTTSVYRLIAEARRAEKVSAVQWPATQGKGKGKTGRTVQMGEGRWRDTEEFLKYGALNNYAYVSITANKLPFPRAIIGVEGRESTSIAHPPSSSTDLLTLTSAQNP